jgi:hypothetical protein
MSIYVLPIRYSKADASTRRAVRTQYIELQAGLCYWCKQPLDGPADKAVTSKPINWKLFPPNFLRYPIHLQHCHKTDLTEGAVHAICNAVMWQYHGR